jgi:putative FmdB family regulatory protein
VRRIIGDGIRTVKAEGAPSLDNAGSGKDNPRSGKDFRGPFRRNRLLENVLPLYEYECGKCGHVFEKIQKYSDPPLKVCPRCKGRVKKLPSAPAIQFKGSGWYITDYARKGSSGGDEKGEKGSKETSSKAEGKETSKSSEGKETPKSSEGKEKSGEKKSSAAPKKKDSSD